jgi:hypothetical protein
MVWSHLWKIGRVARSDFAVLYRVQLLGHRIEAYAAMVAD